MMHTMLVMSTVSSFKLAVIMPEYPMTSVTETLYQLRKTVGNPLHIYGRWYRSHRYVIGLDLGKISGAGFVGLSIKSGDQSTINFKGCDAGNFVSSVPTRMYVLCFTLRCSFIHC